MESVDLKTKRGRRSKKDNIASISEIPENIILPSVSKSGAPKAALDEPFLPLFSKVEQKGAPKAPLDQPFLKVEKVEKVEEKRKAYVVYQK